ncbi:MAG: hypothetical protein ACLUD1_01315 [Clostridia bacterium]
MLHIIHDEKGISLIKLGKRLVIPINGQIGKYKYHMNGIFEKITQF